MLLGFAFWWFAFSDITLADSWPTLLLISWWLLSAASFGYFINDSFDIEKDALASKPNFSSKLSKPIRWLVALGLAASSLAPWLIDGRFMPVLYLAIAQLVLFLLYSVPPIRLKDRLAGAVVTDSLYAQVIPVAVIFMAVKVGLGLSFPIWALVPLFIWALVSGSRYIVEHLIRDYHHDQKAGTYSLVHRITVKRANELISYALFPAELIAFSILMFVASMYIPHYGWWFGVYFIIVFFGSSIGENIKRYNWEHSNESDYKLLNYFYEIGFPLINIGYLIAFDLWYLLILVLFIIAFRPAQNVSQWLVHKGKVVGVEGGIVAGNAARYTTVNGRILLFEIFRRLWYDVLVKIYYHFLLQIYIYTRLYASRAVNYSIYYFRIYVLRYDDERARGNKS